MDRKLPNVYANKIDKVINNTQDVYNSMNTIRTIKNPKNITKKINEIFSSYDHVYKSKVKIKTLNDEFTKEIVGIKDNYLLTIDNDIININSIVDIDKL